MGAETLLIVFTIAGAAWWLNRKEDERELARRHKDLYGTYNVSSKSSEY